MTTTMTRKDKTDQTQPTTTRRSWTFVPVCDILELADEWIVRADLPGTTAENVDINFERGVLTLHAAVQCRQNEQETSFLVREYGVGDFHRTFEIGESVDAEKIHAEFKQGVLTLHLPKSEAVKPRKIAVRPA